jgi:hypothetical protein
LTGGHPHVQGTGSLAEAATSIVETHGWKGLYR